MFIEYFIVFLKWNFFPENYDLMKSQNYLRYDNNDKRFDKFKYFGSIGKRFEDSGDKT